MRARMYPCGSQLNIADTFETQRACVSLHAGLIVAYFIVGRCKVVKLTNKGCRNAVNYVALHCG